jgi:cytochrome c oxidase cbb3-type subunit 1
MLRSFDDYGNLAYTFIETVEFMHTPICLACLGRRFLRRRALVMAYNMVMTVRASRSEQAAVEAKLAAKLAKA